MGNAELTALQSDIMDTYYSDNARKLRGTVDRILRRFGGLSGRDTDDFYSLANEVFVKVMEKYDYKQPFDGFLYSCLTNKIKSEITRRNRKKRRADRMIVSLDEPIGDGDGLTIGDTIADDFDTFQEIYGRHEYQGRAGRYISKLSTRQANILNLLVDGFKPNEIRRILDISAKEYTENLQIIRSYENVKVLF